MDRRERIVYATHAAHDEMRNVGLGADHCVAGCELVAAYLRRHGIATKRWACRLVAANAEAWEWSGQDLARLQDLEVADSPEGARIVLLGFGEQTMEDAIANEKFPGHVILTTRNPDGLIDPTIDQLSMPKFKIDVRGPMTLFVARSTIQDFERAKAAMIGYTEAGAAVAWVPAPDLDVRRGVGFEERSVRETWPELREHVLDLMEVRVRRLDAAVRDAEENEREITNHFAETR